MAQYTKKEKGGENIHAILLNDGEFAAVANGLFHGIRASASGSTLQINVVRNSVAVIDAIEPGIKGMEDTKA